MTVETERVQCFSSIQCLAYLDARNDAPGAETFQGHLDTCERCRVMVAETARAIFGNDGSASAASMRTFNDGEVLGGRYEIRRFIARGGMGEVYEAFDHTLGEAVALKTLSPTTLDQPEATSSLVAEVRLARKVMHPHVCRIFEFGVHRRHAFDGDGGGDVIPFLTMELLEGETLTSRLRRDGPLDPGRALQVLRELCAGLSAVHRAGIVHRDFKTENVFLVRATETGAERAVVMDFGLARALDINRVSRLSSARGLVGTVAYMAPEQVEGARPTPAFDVYALGTVAFELLCGRLPFVAESQLALATVRLRYEPPRPSTLRPDLKPVWDWFISRCLARAPDCRFRTMDAVTRALNRIGAGHEARVPRIIEWFHRPLAVGIATALLLGGGVAAIRYRGRPSRGAEPPPLVQPQTVVTPRVLAVPVPAPALPARVPAPAAPAASDVRAAFRPAPSSQPSKNGKRANTPRPLGRVRRSGQDAPAAAAPVAPLPTASDDDFIDPFSHLRVRGHAP